MKNLLLCIITICLFCLNAAGQDVHFSQFDFSPLHQSAAQTGNFKGDYRLTAINRVQYKSVTVPYKSLGASVDMNIAKTDEKKSWWSAGLLFENDVTGDADYKTTIVDVSVAWNSFLDENKKHQLTLAIQPGWMQNGLNFSELYFGSQYDGDIFDPNLPTGENPERSSYSNFNLNAGAAYKYVFSENSDFNIVFGASHLNQPDISFLNDKAKLFTRLTGIGALNLFLSEKISLQPQVLFYRQGKFSQLNGGANVQLHSFENNLKNFRFSAGLFYRNKDAIIARIGAGIGNLDADFAYDFNTSDLKKASNGRGAYEVALSYIITKVKPLKKNPPCPIY